jgi:small subunit ribosomal protein S9
VGACKINHGKFSKNLEAILIILIGFLRMNKTNSTVPFHGVGRRKSAVARVWLRKGNGTINVNGLDYEKYFHTNDERQMVVHAFKVCGVEKAYNAEININGGGMVGQAGAAKTGVSRALLEADSSLHDVLRQNGLLTVDSRVKERKKYGQKAARRKFQFVKR